MEDKENNIHEINEETISNQSKICPICKSDKSSQFETIDISEPFDTINYICVECGYIMSFAKTIIDLDELAD